MSVPVDQIRSHLNELLNLQSQFSTLSAQSVDKFGKIIEAARVYQNRMDPLNHDMAQLQVLQKNIHSCHSQLSQIQAYRRTAREVESTIAQGPSQSLENYLKVMERIEKALTFFRENNVDDVEFAQLKAFYVLGMKNLNTEFGNILKQTFSPVNTEYLVKLAEQTSTEAEPVNLEQLEGASDHMLKSIQYLARWMNESHPMDASWSQIGPREGARGCLIRYQDYRREVVRQSLLKLYDYLKEQEAQGGTAPAQRSKVNSVAALPKCRPKRPPGFVWDVALRRQLNESETEDLNSEHYSIAVGALVKLMQNERRWLERVQLNTTLQENQVSLDMILKVSSNETLTTGSDLIRLMQRAQGRAEFHMILSLLLVLQKFSQVGVELVEALQGIDHIMSGFNNLVFRLLQQVGTTLEAYVEFLRQLPEHSGASKAQVPPDGTVHELTTNALMYLEHLLEFSDIMSVAFYVSQVGRPTGVSAISFLCSASRDLSQLGPRVGGFMLSAILALMANLDRKSESYADEIVRFVFQMNNIQYILKAIYRTNIRAYIDSYDNNGIAGITSALEERRGYYSRWCARYIVIPNENQLSRVGASSRALDSKERAALKSCWHDLNVGLNNLARQHAVISIPDRDLRDKLRRQLIADLVPPYRLFWEKSTDPFIFSCHMDIFETYKDDLPFVRISAPMVRYSKLPFRLLVREYGTDLAYSPMILVESFLRSSKARDLEFTTCVADRPLIVQLASKDPCEFTLATELLAPYCEGIDLNCGCPQRWALQSGLGSALLRKPELVADLVSAARKVVPRWRTDSHIPNHLSSAEDEKLDSNVGVQRCSGPFSITTKLRVASPGVRASGDDSAATQISATIELIRRLAMMGVDWVTLHSRTPQQSNSDPACWDIVKEVVGARIRNSATGSLLPVVLNGDVQSLEDARRAHLTTGCHGVMVARALLSDPTLFSARSPSISCASDLRNLVNRWFELSLRYPSGTCFRYFHQQTYWMMEHYLDRSRRLTLHSAGSFAGLKDWFDDYWTSVGLPVSPSLKCIISSRQKIQHTVI
ncbi:unnamed protein product [Calicophoron daubneyi]|uniref:tRNA-dihydrouridine synthase n=1 Tax=Calicophoron daubneyi TaxID=300641 RepID=A0AAV2TSG1_CALDB